MVGTSKFKDKVKQEKMGEDVLINIYVMRQLK